MKKINRKTNLIGTVCQCFNYQCGEKDDGSKWQFCYHNRTAIVNKKKITQKYKFIIKNSEFINPKNPKIFFCYIASIFDVGFEENTYRDKKGNLVNTKIIVVWVLITTVDQKLTEDDIAYYDSKKNYLTAKTDFNEDANDDNISFDDDVFDDSFDLDSDFPF